MQPQPSQTARRPSSGQPLHRQTSEQVIFGKETSALQTSVVPMHLKATHRYLWGKERGPALPQPGSLASCSPSVHLSPAEKGKQ